MSQLQEMKMMVDYAGRDKLAMATFSKQYRFSLFQSYAKKLREIQNPATWGKAFNRVAEAETWKELNL